MNRSRPCRPSDAEVIEATAAAWLAEYDDGLTPEQAAELRRWRSADVRHEAAIARLEAAWTALQQLHAYRPAAERHPDRDLLAASLAGRRAGRYAVKAALAASLVLAAAGWWVTVEWRAWAPEPTYATTVDGYERVTLADGSVVELNSASEVATQFSTAERRVRLVRGEAHFTVVRNSARPFVVEANGVAVRAVGTAFNVRLGPNAIEVLVTQGKVAVGEVERAAFAIPTGRTESERSREQERSYVPPAILVVNERVSIPALKSSAPPAMTPLVIEQVAPELVREALAWQGPRLNFVDTPLGEAIVQFNRRNPVQIELADPELASLPIGGSFRVENVDAFVRLLALGGDVVVDRPSATRIVLRQVK